MIRRLIRRTLIGFLVCVVLCCAGVLSLMQQADRRPAEPPIAAPRPEAPAEPPAPVLAEPDVKRVAAQYRDLHTRLEAARAQNLRDDLPEWGRFIREFRSQIDSLLAQTEGKRSGVAWHLNLAGAYLRSMAHAVAMEDDEEYSDFEALFQESMAAAETAQKE